MFDIVLQLLVTLLVAGSVAMMVWALFRVPAAVELAEHRRIAVAMNAGARRTLFENKALTPFMNLFLLIAKRFGAVSVRNHIRNGLNAAGNPNNYSVDEFLALCIGGGITAMALCSAVFLLAGSFEPIITVIVGVIGLLNPIWFLRSAARARRLQISKQLPYTLDLIALVMQAGASFAEAVETIIRDNPDDSFNQELSIVMAEIEFGTPRAQALINLSDRVGLETLQSIVGAVNQADALGTPLAHILKSQSGMLRMHRSVRAEKLASSASLQILIPTMLILLGVALIILGPIIIRFMSGDLDIARATR